MQSDMPREHVKKIPSKCTVETKNTFVMQTWQVGIGVVEIIQLIQHSGKKSTLQWYRGQSDNRRGKEMLTLDQRDLGRR